MFSVAHIINPVVVPESSDLYVAQPVTFEAMRRAKAYAEGVAEIRLLTAQYQEDRPLVSDGFVSTPDLNRSVVDLGTFQRHRRLPLLADILERGYDASEGCDYLVFTNVDIAVMPYFYETLAALVGEGYDAFVINRRTVSGAFTDIGQLPLMLAQAGDKHPGHDCFVFARESFPSYDLGRVCVGAPFVGLVLLLNLACHARRFEEFRNLHATFHLGNDRVWKKGDYEDYRSFNRGECLKVIADLEARFGPLDKVQAAARFLPREIRYRSGPRRIVAGLEGVVRRLFRGPK